MRPLGNTIFRLGTSWKMTREYAWQNCGGLSVLYPQPLLYPFILICSSFQPSSFLTCKQSLNCSPYFQSCFPLIPSPHCPQIDHSLNKVISLWKKKILQWHSITFPNNSKFLGLASMALHDLALSYHVSALSSLLMDLRLHSQWKIRSAPNTLCQLLLCHCKCYSLCLGHIGWPDIPQFFILCSWKSFCPSAFSLLQAV